jgi:hypothetical protein
MLMNRTDLDPEFRGKCVGLSLGPGDQRFRNTILRSWKYRQDPLNTPARTSFHHKPGLIGFEGRPIDEAGTMVAHENRP